MDNPADVDMSGSEWIAPIDIIPHPKASRFEQGIFGKVEVHTTGYKRLKQDMMLAKECRIS